MSFDVNWDIEKYKEEHESEDHWILRRNFMERWKQSYPEDRLVCLARVFANMEFMGCRYPREVMQEVARMSKEVNKNLTYNIKKLSFDGKAIVERSSGDWSSRNRCSRINLQADTYFDDNRMPLGQHSSEIDETKKFGNDSMRRRNFEATKGLVNTSSVGRTTNPESIVESYVSQYSGEVMQVPENRSNMFRTTLFKNNAYKPQDQRFADDNISTCYQEKDMQGLSLSSYRFPSNTWQNRDPRRNKQCPISKSIEVNQTDRYPMSLDSTKTDTTFENTQFCAADDMQFDNHARASQDQFNYNNNNRNAYIHEVKPALSQHIGSSVNFASQMSERTTFSDSSIKGYSDTQNYFFFRTGSGFPVFEDRSGDQTLTENPNLEHGAGPNRIENTISNMDTVPKQNICIDVKRNTPEINEGKIHSKVDLTQSSLGVSKVEETGEPAAKIKIVGAASRRYQYWLQAGKTKEEARELCQKRLWQIPEYKVIKKTMGSVTLFRDLNRTARNVRSGIAPVMPLSSCRTRKQRFRYWIQKGKTVIDAKTLSLKSARNPKDSKQLPRNRCSMVNLQSDTYFDNDTGEIDEMKKFDNSDYVSQYSGEGMQEPESRSKDLMTSSYAHEPRNQKFADDNNSTTSLSCVMKEAHSNRFVQDKSPYRFPGEAWLNRDPKHNTQCPSSNSIEGNQTNRYPMSFEPSNTENVSSQDICYEGNMHSKVDLTQSLCVSEVEKTSEPAAKINMVGGTARRYFYWLNVGKTKEEATELCQKRLSQIPEYKEIKKSQGSVTHLRMLNRTAIEVRRGCASKMLLSECRTKQQRLRYWIQKGKTVIEAQALSRISAKKQKDSTQLPIINKTKFKCQKSVLNNNTKKALNNLKNTLETNKKREKRLRKKERYKENKKNRMNNTSIPTQQDTKECILDSLPCEDTTLSNNATSLRYTNSTIKQNAGELSYTNPITTENASKLMFTNTTATGNAGKLIYTNPTSTQNTSKLRFTNSATSQNVGKLSYTNSTSTENAGKISYTNPTSTQNTSKLRVTNSATAQNVGKLSYTNSTSTENAGKLSYTNPTSTKNTSKVWFANTATTQNVGKLSYTNPNRTENANRLKSANSSNSESCSRVWFECSTKTQNPGKISYTNLTSTQNASKPMFSNSSSFKQCLVNHNAPTNLINTTVPETNKRREKRLRKKARQRANKQSCMNGTTIPAQNATRQSIPNSLPSAYLSKANATSTSKPMFANSSSEYASKLMVQNTGVTKQNSHLKVCIMDVNKAIHQQEYNALKRTLPQCIGNEDISILHCENRSGCVIVTCADEYSRDWLDKEIPTFVPWNGAQLTVINEDEISWRSGSNY